MSTVDAADAVFSIHDVMPETLPLVSNLISRFEAAGKELPALLVVPGRQWREKDLAQLRDWEARGAEMLAHGWHHHTEPRRLYHRLHAAFLSRNVAEHLALDPDEINALLLRSRSWFDEVGLKPPSTYVPPAWALGTAPARLERSPYSCIETLQGVWLRDVTGIYRMRKLPLLGFEADTGARAWFLRRWNRLQENISTRRERPLRISIHPHDASLQLADDMDAIIRRPWRTLRYADLGLAASA